MDKKVYNAVSKRADGECEVCKRSGNLELHHILLRKVPATVDNCIMLCSECHRGTNGVHGMNGHKLDMFLRTNLQKFYIENGFSEDETRKLMAGRLYLE
jgi:hypothetical protein